MATEPQQNLTKINFVSLISRDDKPLYIQAFDIDVEEPTLIDRKNANKFLKYNFLSHMALDVFSSPMSLNLRERQQQQNDGILLLFIQDDVMVYGMETNNGLKVIVGVGSDEPAMSKLKLLFSSIHKCYLKTICNPFTDLLNAGKNDELLQSPKFDKRIKDLVAEWD